MIKKNVVALCVSAVIVSSSATGCAGMNRQIEEMNARGTIDAGGYTWKIPADSEGGNTIRTHGIPSRQAATEASTILCKKHGRIAQYASHRATLITGSMTYSFNCVL